MTVISMIGGTTPGDKMALDYALSIARRMASGLQGLCAFPDPSTALIYSTSPYMIGVGGAAVEGIQQAQAKLTEDCREMFQAVVAQSGDDVATAFEAQTETAERAGVRAATLADAIVFPRAVGTGEHVLAPAFERIMMDARLPLVIAGNEGEVTGAGLIAWDGSPQAARAVRLHEPLLRMLGRAVIAQNPSDLGGLSANPAARPSALSDWLSARGIESETADFEGKISEGLIQLAADRGCEVIVAGAYGSSRAGEFLFGGATRGLLRADSAPALALAH